MKLSPRLYLPILGALATIAASPLSMTDENQNYRQLQDMPRERRLALLEDLDRFEKLDPSERSRIRKLDSEIATRTPVDQVRYRSMMRRYQLWLKGLSEKQQEELRSTEDPEERLTLALKFRKEEQKSQAIAQRLFGIRTGYFGLMGPFEAAQLLRIWHSMPANERWKIENREGKGRYAEEVRDYGKRHQAKAHPFPDSEEKKYDEILLTNDEFKKQLQAFADRFESGLKKDEAAKAKGEHGPMRFRYRFAEFLYLEDHRPKPVSQQNLEKFSNFCPAWFHSMIDPLSADDARNYITFVYRLIFTENGEITAEWKPSKEKSIVAPTAPRPATKRSGASGPL